MARRAWLVGELPAPQERLALGSTLHRPGATTRPAWGQHPARRGACHAALRRPGAQRGPPQAQDLLAGCAGEPAARSGFRGPGSAVGVPRSGFRGALPATSRSRFSRPRRGAAWPPPARLAVGRRSAGSGHGFLFSLKRFQGNYRHRDFPSLKVNAVYMHIFIHKMVTVIHNHSYH